jgi:cytosine/adenosine deaminase-related metal-dependent hydrolase
MHLALRNNHRRDEEIEYALWCCTFGGALALNLSNYGISVGSKADLVLVDAETVAHAVVSHPVRKLVMKSGKVVARDGLYIKEAP